METSRLEAFSDGVLAVIITIMVLDFRVPAGATLPALASSLPTFIVYALSFVYVGIYWNNHHHLFHVTERMDGRVMWANLHLLFWLSLVPFVTAWVGRFPSAALPAAVYGAILFLAALAYSILQSAITACNGGHASTVARALGSDWKGKVSLAACATGVFAAFASPWLSYALYFAVATLWFVPDRRIEQIES